MYCLDCGRHTEGRICENCGSSRTTDTSPNPSVYAPPAPNSFFPYSQATRMKKSMAAATAPTFPSHSPMHYESYQRPYQGYSSAPSHSAPSTCIKCPSYGVLRDGYLCDHCWLKFNSFRVPIPPHNRSYTAMAHQPHSLRGAPAHISHQLPSKSSFKINLAGYLTSHTQYDNPPQPLLSASPIIPFNAQYDDYESDGIVSNQSCLNVTWLPQTDVQDVLVGDYSKQYAISRQQTLATIIPLENIVQKIQGNVIALSIGKSEPIATGLLIAPRLLLTGRHCVEGLKPTQLIARQNYQKVADVMDFGLSVNILGVVEAGHASDYVILLLAQDMQYQPLTLCTEASSESSILIHHPQGGPKKVSVHIGLGSQNYQLHYSAYHDSAKGSSGGIYCNAKFSIFALHLLKTPQDNLTSAYEIKNILQVSSTLRTLYPYPSRKYSQEQALQMRIEYRTDRLPIIYNVSPLRRFLERVDKPQYYQALEDYKGIAFDRHHIIPIGDMAFLWMMSKENQQMEQLLFSLQQYTELDNGILTINDIEWAPWNLFIGPHHRTDDPHDGNIREANKPLSFNSVLWDHIVTLHVHIKIAWGARNALRPFLRTDLIKQLEIGSTISLSDAVKLGGPFAKFREYHEIHKTIFKQLKNIKTCCRYLSLPHLYDSDDWQKGGVVVDRQGHQLQAYKLRLSPRN